jgi:hypothetical protein
MMSVEVRQQIQFVSTLCGIADTRDAGLFELPCQLNVVLTSKSTSRNADPEASFQVQTNILPNSLVLLTSWQTSRVSPIDQGI